jgi:hypothetical protein
VKFIHIALDEHGLEGQWIDLRDPRFLSKRTIDRWQRQNEAGSLSTDEFLREFIAAWHIVDADTGADLNDPKTDSIDGAPLVVFQVLNERIRDAFRGSVAAAGGGGTDGGVADGNSGGSAPTA